MKDGSGSRRRAAALGCAALLLTVPAAGQAAERPAALTLPQAKIYGYATPVIIVQAGEEVTYTNLDIEMHDVVQDVETDGFGSGKKLPWCKKQKGKGHGDGHAHEHAACPLFWSALIGVGDTTPILGIKDLKAGAYSFFCTIHHGMTGTLQVI